MEDQTMRSVMAAQANEMWPAYWKASQSALLQAGAPEEWVAGEQCRAMFRAMAAVQSGMFVAGFESGAAMALLPFRLGLDAEPPISHIKRADLVELVEQGEASLPPGVVREMMAKFERGENPSEFATSTGIDKLSTLFLPADTE